MNRYLGHDPNESIREIRAREPAWFDHAEAVSACVSDLIPQLHVQRGDIRQLVSAVLYRRIASAFEAIIVLAERGMYTEGLIQRRSMIEGLFVLYALWKEPSLVDKYIEDDLHRVLRILKNIKRTSRVIQDAIASKLPSVSLDETVADLKSSAAGRNAIKVAAYAEAAGLFDYYLTDYSFASEASHHVAKDIERQIALDVDGDVDGIYWGPEVEPPSELLSNAVDYMLMAIAAIERIFDLGASEVAYALRERTDVLNESRRGGAVPG